MSSASSREVTGKKKKDVWEEAGSEFYQERYPCGSAQASSTVDLANNTTQRRVSRNHIPLPSQTARRNSFIPTGRRYTRKQSFNANTNATITANNCMTFNSTMAGTANGTDVHVALMPDLADETIPNEKNTYEALMKIKALPEPMAQKRLRKAKITAIPKLRLRGWRMLKWEVKLRFGSLSQIWNRRIRTSSVFQNSLQKVEVRCGTSIVNVFLFVKWTMFLNLAISIVIAIFIIFPFFISAWDIASQSVIPGSECNDPGSDSYNDATERLECCTKRYQIDVLNSTRGSLGDIIRVITQVNASIENTPFFYGYYIHSSRPNEIDGFAMTYVLVFAFIMLFCLILMVRSIGTGIQEMVLSAEGEFYKYSNLVFAGWDHYTKDDKGAAFKRKILLNEMKIALQTEKQNLESLIRSRKARIKLAFIRIFVNLAVIALLAVVGACIYEVSGQSLKVANEPKEFLKTRSQEHFQNLIYSFAPSVLISFFNLIFPSILTKLGKLENYSVEKETTLVLIRALFVRLMSIGFAAVRFYVGAYCDLESAEHCSKCSTQSQSKFPILPLKTRKLCWESLFAEQIYKLIVADLLLKCVVTFIVDPLRRLFKRYFKNKICQIIGDIKFSIVRHSLDMIYLQVLSWLGMYFGPFIPLFAVLYCYLVFYLKKFSVLYNCTAVPDTYKTVKTTTIFVAAKLLSFIAVAFTNVTVMGFMVPSRGCGPFREYQKPWEAVIRAANSSEWSQSMYSNIASPGVTTPLTIILVLLSYYYYSVAMANRGMVDTLRHLLILEGHDKQYLFARLNSLRRETNSLNSGRTE